MHLAPAMPHALLMLTSYFAQSSEHCALAGHRPGLKPGLALTRVSNRASQACVAVVALLLHVESWQDSRAEAMRVPNDSWAPGEQEAAIADLAAATLEQWRKVWVHHMEVLLDPAFQADPRSEARALLKAITDHVGAARCRREPKTPMLACRPQVGDMQPDNKSPVMCRAILWRRESDTSDPQQSTDNKSTLLLWPCQGVFALQRVLPCIRLQL